jgi:TPR repeat protein
MDAWSRSVLQLSLGFLLATSTAHGAGSWESGEAAPPPGVAELLSRATQGDVDAQFQLAVAYEDGLVVPRDMRESVRWYRAAAESGNVDAQASLGALYALDLDALPVDYAESLAWSRRAAAQGSVQAQYNLGVMYRDGLGVLPDAGEALIWFRRAAEQGDRMARYNLGALYGDADSGLQGVDQAVHWYRLAALQGYPGAYYNLGVMYFNGAGVKQDRVLAYALFTLAEATAESQGIPEAGPSQMAAQTMTGPDLADGKALAARMAADFGDALEVYLARQHQ